MSGKTGNKGWNDPPAVSGMAGGSAGQTASRVSDAAALHPSVGCDNGSTVDRAADDDVTDRRQFIIDQVLHWKKVSMPVLSARQAGDMEQQLGVMTELLSSDSLSSALEDRLHKLMLAMAASDRAAVRNIQADIVLNHAGEISSWMLGLKRLVHKSTKQFK